MITRHAVRAVVAGHIRPIANADDPAALIGTVADDGLHQVNGKVAMRVAGGPEARVADDQGDDDVGGIGGIGGVCVIILTGGAFGDGGKDLQRHIAFQQARHIRVAAIAPVVQVTVPQQAVGMPPPR